MRITRNVERLLKILFPQENSIALVELLGKVLIDRLLLEILKEVCDERKLFICTQYFGIGCRPQTQESIGKRLPKPITSGAVSQIIWHVQWICGKVHV